MEELREAAFDALLRGSDDLILIVDREGRILHAGGQALAHFGEVLRQPGANLLDQLSVNSRRSLLAFLDAIATDGTISLDHDAEKTGVGDVETIRYAVHAIPRAGLRRDFLLVGRPLMETSYDEPGVEPLRVDPLTGLANRAGMTTRLASLWAERQSDPYHPLAWVLMADVDRFKELNDTRGHLAGDDMLAALARALVTSVRERDVVARYGGDEFLLAGRANDASDVERIATRVVQVVRELEIPAPAPGESPLRATISVGGVLAAPGPRCAERDAIAAADRCLYRAKQAGRDRAVVDLGGVGLDLTPG